MDTPEKEELPWTAAQRMEGWAGELRVNLIRLAAIAAFYGHHLFNQVVLKQEFPPSFTAGVTAVAVAWTIGALGLHMALNQIWLPTALRYLAVCFDLVLVTALLVISDGPRSPLIILLFLVIATAPLRMDLRLVWATTLLAMLSYGILCGHAKWKRPEWQVPRRQQIVIVLGLGAAGLLAGQSVRQARRFALDYADRVRPEDPA